jgi:hypothetical protein
MEHDEQDTLKDYWSTPEQFYIPFYSNMMKYDQFFHVFRFLHFLDNMNQPIKTDKNYDRPWKIRSPFDMLNDTNAKFYSRSENLAVDEVMLFKGSVIFKQHIPKIKIYKLCDVTGYTYDMSVYLRKDWQYAIQAMTVTHTKVKSLTISVEGIGHKLYMNNFFSYADVFD